MQKNVAGQKLLVYAFDSTTNLPKTADGPNIRASVSKDFAAIADLADTSAAELDATIAKGFYHFDVSQGETDGNVLIFSARSSTANIVVVAVPAKVYTLPLLSNVKQINDDATAAANLAKTAGAIARG